MGPAEVMVIYMSDCKVTELTTTICDVSTLHGVRGGVLPVSFVCGRFLAVRRTSLVYLHAVLLIEHINHFSEISSKLRVLVPLREDMVWDFQSARLEVSSMRIDHRHMTNHVAHATNLIKTQVSVARRRPLND